MVTSALSFEEEIFAEQALQGVSRSFALTIPQLPSVLRPIVTNAYLLCRIADTIEDNAGLSLDQKHYFFNQFISVLNRASSPRGFAQSLYPLLTESASPAERDLILNTPLVVHSLFRFEHYQQEVIRRCVEVMSSGMLKFQQIKSSNGLPTLQDTTTYCYFVAGCVGEMLTDLFCGYSPEISTRRDKLFPLASSFGRGLQMTNILKDIWEDRSHGVCWLPRDIFDQAGFSLSHLGSGTYKPAFGLALTRLTGITRFYLKKGLDYSLHLPVSETGIRKFCLWSIGMAIFTLRNINRNPDFSSAVEVKISRTTAKTIMAVSRATIRSNFMLQFFFTVFAWGLPSANSGRRYLRTAFKQGSGEPIGQCGQCALE